LQAQLDLARSKGLTIAYVDAHMAFPWLFEESDEHRLCEVMQKWAQKEGLIYAGWGNTLGFKRLPELQGEKGDPLQSLAERINAAEPGTYLVVTHPMYDDEEARKANHGKNEPGEVARSRDMQRRMFMDPVILKAYKEKQAEPIRYIDAFSA
jgi:hypothetical protein